MMRTNSSILFVVFTCALLLSTLISSSSAQSCNSETFASNAGAAAATSFQLCTNLPVLSSSIHWTANPSDGTVSVAFLCRGVTASNPKWCAWGVNLNGGQMVGTQALVAHVDTLSGAPQVRTVPISSYTTTLAAGRLSFPVSNLTAAFGNGGMVIFGTLGIPAGASRSKMTQVWQQGDVRGNTLQPHPVCGDNVRSFSTWDLTSGSSPAAGGVLDLPKRT